MEGQLKRVFFLLNEVYKILHAYDWFVSGDSGEEYFNSETQDALAEIARVVEATGEDLKLPSEGVTNPDEEYNSQW